MKAGDILPNSKLIRTCVYLCLVLQKFLWKNHARLLQNQQDCYLKSIFSQFLTFHDCPREEMNCPGLLSGRVTDCLGRSSPVNAGSEGQPAPSCLLRAFLISCPQGIPTAAAAQKSPVDSIFVTTKGKFP